MTDAQGRPLEVVPLPMPRPMFHDDQRLPACYMNFYIANGVVVVPQFGDPADRVAMESWRGYFPAGRFAGSTRWTWCGAWARFIASRSSNRREPGVPIRKREYPP